jgi:hypothetical protein
MAIDRRANAGQQDSRLSAQHKVFEPTSRAIDGLENALAGLDLLDDALALDLRRPQDNFQRIWNTALRATDLAANDADTDPTDRTEQAQ